ncbi:MAG TPA: threonine/serine dehydratase [Alphaproteobacteria bacterium]
MRLLLDRTGIIEAQARVGPYIRRTPVMELEPGAFGLPCRVMLKLEQLQLAGSFKPRGAFNRMLSNPIPEAGVIAASGGNHGVAVALAARRLGVPAAIFVPTIASPAKLQRIREEGAEVVVGGATYAEALAASTARAEETGALVVHAYDQPEVVLGQGTVGLELQEQAPGLDCVLVAVGGGGLIGGIALAYEGAATRIVGVEPRLAPTLHDAMAAGRPVPVAVSGIAADSLGARETGGLAFEIARPRVERVVLVEDEAIREAQRAVWRELRIVVEPGGAAAFAALLSGAHPAAREARVGIVLCGGNADPGSVA